LVLCASLFQCGFPEHTFFEEDCYNGKDDDGNGLTDCEDPSCKGLVLCVPQVMGGWAGPVAIWRGGGLESAPSCLEANYKSYPYDLFEGEPHARDTDASVCPACECGSSGNPGHCEARLRLYSDVSCRIPLGVSDTAYPVTSTCQSISVDTTASKYYMKAEPPTVVGGCAANNTQPDSFPSVAWDFKLRACATSQGRRCGEHDCLDVPPAPFANFLCVYRAGDVTAAGAQGCPEGYPNPFAVYNEPIDSRQCSECTCTQTGLACPVSAAAVGDYGASEGCSTQRWALPYVSECTEIDWPMPSSFKTKLTNPVEPSGMPGPCYPSNVRTVTGAVSKGQSVSVCCTSPQ
jgi:hypothetical protein